ncbi:MAG: hypothetical protein KIT83_07910 [Bryobacterales bacterium]|nr:hypothetical protein [Bryobacterales bacterium]
MTDHRTVILARLGSTQHGTRYRWHWLAPPMQPMLDDFARRYPNTKSRIVSWFTGQPHPDLDRVSAIIFFMQDPLRERFPLDFQQAVALADAARARGIRLVNPPENLSNTIKSTQARLWRDAGIPTPRHHSYSSYEELMSLTSTLDYPVLIKSDLLHVQAHMHVCQTAADLRALKPEQIACPGSVADFIDTRETYRQIRPDSVWGRFYHKKRACLIGSRSFNNHVFFSTNPIVGASTCTFRHYTNPNPIARWTADRRCRDEVALDYAFFEAPPEHTNLIRRAGEALGLEYLAIDYATTADGRPILWEANPYFAMHMFPRPILRGPRQMDKRIARFHDVAHDFIVELLAERTS